MIVGPAGCRACGTSAPVIGSEGRFPTWWCRQCGHLTVAPEDETTPDVYDRLDYAGFRPDPVFVASAERELQRLEPGSGTARLLDVGCGNGMGLEAAANVGFEAYGIDLSSAAVELCRRRGLAAEVRDVRDFQLGDEWDVATMWDVLEHIGEPEPFLESVHDRLRPGGILLIKVPAVSAREARAMLRWAPRVGAMALQVPEHVNYYTRHSLSRLLNRTGFSVERESTREAFRSRPRGGSPKRRLARVVNSTAMRLCKGQQLLIQARATP